MPDAVLVRGSAAAWYAHHRESFDHDRVLADLRDRFDLVLETIARTKGWVTNRVTPGKFILGELGDIEAGARPMIRRRPLEVAEIELPYGRRLRVPTFDEILRAKAFLIVRRDQTRDFLDVAAVAERAEVARLVQGFVDASGLGRAAFAEAIGTSTSRRSTYLTGKVAPSSALLVRMERVSWRAAAGAAAT